MIGVISIIPAAHSGIVRSTNLEYRAKYNHIVVLIEADAVDSRSMTRILANILALNHIGEDDILIPATRDELGVVLTDIERVDVIVVDIAIIFDEEIFGWIVEANPTILGTSHAVLSVTVELYCVDWTRVAFHQLAEFRRNAIRNSHDLL